jgi:7,8-dihydroneopterin aldolase/epimerase/oxygenase
VSVLVEIAGLELHGRHGALEEERTRDQTFLFDVELEIDLPGAETDALADTVDYREVVAVVREVSDGRAFALIEALATALADALVARFPVARARVRVRKPEVVLDAPVDFTAATAEAVRAPS